VTSSDIPFARSKFRRRVDLSEMGSDNHAMQMDARVRTKDDTVDDLYPNAFGKQTQVRQCMYRHLRS